MHGCGCVPDNIQSTIEKLLGGLVKMWMQTSPIDGTKDRCTYNFFSFHARDVLLESGHMLCDYDLVAVIKFHGVSSKIQYFAACNGFIKGTLKFKMK
ncbi:hypothetical protein LWI28_004524 [Acer negundo]|uniref:Uncharacterized protein n=1 Tax=Acer negundo TaxID=4023 RepID=A0AAD5NL78_ACENE|nr:hypothetical protein LWI28_004524 [Acer negundo]KAK4842553.1 hypothetical protein QYF36_023605 [Acer negundo]